MKKPKRGFYAFANNKDYLWCRIFYFDGKKWIGLRVVGSPDKYAWCREINHDDPRTHFTYVEYIGE